MQLIWREDPVVKAHLAHWGNYHMNPTNPPVTTIEELTKKYHPDHVTCDVTTCIEKVEFTQSCFKRHIVDPNIHGINLNESEATCQFKVNYWAKSLDTSCHNGKVTTLEDCPLTITLPAIPGYQLTKIEDLDMMKCDLAGLDKWMVDMLEQIGDIMDTKEHGKNDHVPQRITFVNIEVPVYDGPDWETFLRNLTKDVTLDTTEEELGKKLREKRAELLRRKAKSEEPSVDWFRIPGISTEFDHYKSYRVQFTIVGLTPKDNYPKIVNPSIIHYKFA